MASARLIYCRLPLPRRSLPYELQRAGYLLPLALHGELQRAAVLLLVRIRAVGVELQLGREVLAAVVVHHLYLSRALVDNRRRYDYPRISALPRAEVSVHLAEHVLPRHGEVIVVQVHLNVDLISPLITPRTKAILGVSLFGQACELFRLKQIAHANNIALIEDGAQSFGAQIFCQDKWHKSLSIADISTTSFFPAKPLGCFGDGGAIFTPHEHIAKRIASLRIHAQNKRYYHDEIGISSRLDALQAAILHQKLSYFDEMIEKRNAIAKHYLTTLGHIELVKLPNISSHKKSVFAQFSILAQKRDSLQAFLKDRGIPTAIHYPIILPKQKAFSYLKTKENFDNAIYASQNILSLPINPYLSINELRYITQSIGDFYG